MNRKYAAWLRWLRASTSWYSTGKDREVFQGGERGGVDGAGVRSMATARETGYMAVMGARTPRTRAGTEAGGSPPSQAAPVETEGWEGRCPAPAAPARWPTPSRRSGP